jgi:integrase
MDGQKLTQRHCEGAESQSKTYFLWDSDVQGFGLRVTHTGTKAFVVQYRAGYGRSGQTRRMTIGRYGNGIWTVEKARREAKRLLGEVATGGDPLGALRANSDVLTVSALCELYFAEGCETKKPLTVQYDKARAEGHIKPLIGKFRLSTVTRADVEKMMRDIAAGKTAHKAKGKARGVSRFTGGKTAATRTVGLLQGIFTFAEQRGLMPSNPAKGIKRYPDVKKERFLSSAELARLGDALAAMQGEGVNPHALNIIRMLCLTGARRNEIAGLEWRAVDLERGAIMLADSKTGKKAFPLAPAAALLLSGLPREVGSKWVFPATSGDNHFSGVNKIWQQARERAKLEDVRLHDLRHTFASFGASSGFGLPVLGAILGQKQASTTARYAHLADDPVKHAAGRIGDTISAHMTRKHGG